MRSIPPPPPPKQTSQVNTPGRWRCPHPSLSPVLGPFCRPPPGVLMSVLYLPMSLAAPSPAEAGSCALGVPGPPLSSAPSHQHQDPPQILTFQLHPGVPCPQGCAPPGAQGQLCPRNPPPLHLAGSWLGTPTSWGHPCGRGSPHPGVTGLRVWFGGPQLCWWLRSFSPPSCPRGGSQPQSGLHWGPSVPSPVG